MTLLYFTATGNSLYVAKSLSQRNNFSIPQLLENDNVDIIDDKIGIVFPCYCGGLPIIVENFLSSAKLDAPYIFAIITFGGMVANASGLLEKFSLKYGIKFDYINSVSMVDNYLPMFETEDQLAKLPQRQVEKQITKIKEDIESSAKYKPKCGFKEKLIGKGMQVAKGSIIGGNVDSRFSINDNCIKCSICVKVCPVANIALKENVEFMHHCEGCLACIHHCPVNAIHMKNEKSSARFSNSHVTLDEIIAANNIKSL